MSDAKKRCDIPNELRAELKELDEKGIRRKSEIPHIAQTASATECTGLMYSAPKNAEEYEAYQDLYSTETPQDDVR